MSQSFHDVRFPTAISRHSRGGPERQTQIVQLVSGHEQRNTRWADSRRRYNAGYGIKTLDDLAAVIDFFEQRRGRLYGFRWKDHADYKSCRPSQSPTYTDQLVGIGDGQADRFLLKKIYGQTTNPYARPITKPVPGTVSIGVDGFVQTLDEDYVIDHLTGEVTFLANAIPSSGVNITAGFEFDVPVRFDTDFLEISHEAFAAGQMPQIDIIEIKQ